jgi:hypothetical protein
LKTRRTPASWEGWTERNNAKLEELAPLGKSAAEIATVLGCSRDAVIGRIYRTKLPWLCKPAAHTGPRPERRTRPHRPPPVPRRLSKPKPPIAIAEPTVPPVTILALEPHHCRYVVTPFDAEPLFCGAAKAAGSPYCGFHRLLCVAAAQPRGGAGGLVRLAGMV